MKEMELDQRPREKAARYGVETLQDEELLCLLIGSGTSQIPVQSIARAILKATDNLSDLFSLHLSRLLEIQGIGEARALSLMAAVELTKRSLKIKAYKTRIRIPSDAVQWLEAQYGSEPQENFICIYLDSRGQILQHKVLSKGTLNLTTIHPRDVFREAYLFNAHSVFFVHNHPSQDVIPSVADIETTRAMEKAAALSKIPILDHLIVSRSDYFSFYEHGMLGMEEEEEKEEKKEETNLEDPSDEKKSLFSIPTHPLDLGDWYKDFLPSPLGGLEG